MATTNRFNVENVAGTGPYVGWLASRVRDPLVQFFFDGPVDIDTVRIHADDSNAGGVDLPAAIDFIWAGGSRRFGVVDPDAGVGPSWLDFRGLGLVGLTSLSVRFVHPSASTSSWVFVDEVPFEGRRQAVPEPAPLALLAAAGAALAWTGRRRRAA